MAIVKVNGYGLIEDLYITKDLATDIDTPIESWDASAIFHAKFEGNINAGSFDTVWGNVDGFKIKRRYKGDFDWLSLTYIPNDGTASSFVYSDSLVVSNKEVEYAIVPVSGGIEQGYIIKSLNTKFNKIYLCDAAEVYSFSAGVSYGDEERVQKVGVFEPYGRKYPVVVSNGNIGYSTGSIQATILQDDYLDARQLDRMAIVTKRKALNEFLTNKKAKLLKDWNGNAFLISITGNPSVSYKSDIGMGLADISVDWVEVGDAENRNDLIRTGIIAGES